ncbi:hypothetical protein Tsubulata_047109 [Turnera subulata]|uniref:Transmembrane protein n=1 Tax=Turnera subulata TaxID=218843 RepID=A0A9Q0FVG5_9ROSI|nr:hypothetical protein Tsubulata_047109 [Turnera subulata]
MASVISSLPGQQQQPGEIEQQQLDPQTGSSSASPWHSSGSASGSIGPFFAVISVLAVLCVISCILGRMCTRRERAGLDHSIKHRGCLGLVKRKCRWRVAGDVEVGAKVMALSEGKQNGKTKDGVAADQP